MSNLPDRSKYDDQGWEGSANRRIAQLEDELLKVQGEYRQLQELSGQALVRAHVARGRKELDSAKATEELERLYTEIILLEDMACDALAYIGNFDTRYAARDLGRIIDVLRKLVPEKEADRLSRLIVQRAKAGKDPVDP